MGQHLLILRHAHAEQATAGRDLDRPLTAEGHDDARRIGGWLKEADWTPDRIVASPARRARETAEAIADATGILPEEVLLDDRVYENAVPSLRGVLADHASARVLLIVGHNPGLETLLTTLAGPLDRRPDGKLLTPGTVAVVELPDGRIDDGAASAIATVRPDDLG